MNKFLRVLAAAAVLALLPQVAAAGFLNVPKGSLDLPTSSRINARGYALAPAGFYTLCSVMPSACKMTRAGNAKARSAGIKLDLAAFQVIDKVNREVNASMRPQRESGTKDVWKIGGGSGDCEDYALTKRAMLLRKGFPSSALLMAAVENRGEGHAVLVVRTSRGDFVLDNLSKVVRPWSATGYSFKALQSPDNPRIWNKV